ncbi:MAG: hypothetical protein EXR72_14660 [Myxococcales bacterium]|nr:hypothetical protein [Myxococcales bacterium]
MVRDEVLRPLPSDDLRVYIVWVPILDRDDRSAAQQATPMLDDRRATQFFDGSGQLARSLGAVLAIPPRAEESARTGIAWDVYLAYPRGARFGDGPPLPSLWMHQLSQVDPGRAPRLDGEVLRARIAALLTGTN